MRRISQKQIIILRAIASKVFGPCNENCKSGGERCDFHSWLDNQFFYFDPPKKRRKSTRQLTVTEAATAINALLQMWPDSKGKIPIRKMCPRGHTRYYGSGYAGALTQNQANRIAELEEHLCWQDNPNRLRGFIRKQTGLNKSVEMLTNRQASKVILGLEKLIKSLYPEVK